MTDFNDSWRSGGKGRGPYILYPRTNTEVPLTLQAIASSLSTDYALQVKNYAGTSVFSVDYAGNLSFSGSGIVVVDQTITGNLTVNGNTILGNSATDTTTITGVFSVVGTSTISGASTFGTLNDSSTASLFNTNVTVMGATAFNGHNVFNGDSTFAQDVTLINGSNLILSGGVASGKGLIQFQSAASNGYDTNLLYVSSTAMTMGIIAGSSPSYAAANGPFIGLRGNTYSAVITQRGNLFFGAGNPSAAATGEGEIRFTTGADVLRLVVNKSGVTYIPTPATNKFVVGGTAVIGANSVSNFISDSGSYEPISIQNTAVTGWSQLDIYNSANALVAGFGYANSSAPVQPSKAYFYTAARDFHISTDSNTTRHFAIAATSGAATFNTLATAGGVAGFTYTPGAHTAVTANVTDFKVAAHTMTITGGYASQIFSSFAAPIVSAASGLTLTNVANVNIEMASVAGSALITANSALFLGSPAAAVTVANIAGTHLSLLETGNQSFTLTAATQITNAIGVAGATFGTMTVNQSGGAVTVDNTATVYIAGAFTAGASVTLTNNYALFVDDGASRFDGAIIENQGTDIASATTIVIPTNGNTFELTGTTAVTLITKTGYQDGHEITLTANENVTITNGTATSGNDITIKLAGAANFAMTADDTLTLKLTSTTAGGQAWREVSRSAN